MLRGLWLWLSVRGRILCRSRLSCFRLVRLWGLLLIRDGLRVMSSPLLETVIEMLDELGRPDEYFDCIQIAGTNGKTSTTRFSAAILRGEGLKTALFDVGLILVRYPERMEIDGRVVSDEVFAHGVSAAYEAGHRLNARRVAAGQDAPYYYAFRSLYVAGLLCLPRLP